MIGARRSLLAATWLVLPAALVAAPALAQVGPPPPSVGSTPGEVGPPQSQVGVTPPAPIPPPAPPATTSTPVKGPTFSVNGYVETAYTYSLEKPSNGEINYRGFDNRHNTFTLQNAVVDATGSILGLSARVALQVGSTPSTYYAAGSEPTLPGGASIGPSTPDYWRFIQQAYAGWTAPVAKGLQLEAGIFLSPIGPEVMQAKDDWNYSRSNLFFGLPFYHTGARATLQVTDRTSIAFWVVNGWNSVVDNNSGKSIISLLGYKIPDKFQLQLLYMGGPERNENAPEGQPWRHLADAYAQWDVNGALSLLGQADGGMERNDFGLSYWGAAALYARVHPVSWLYLAARGDVFEEHRGSGATGTASPIFFPASWVSSGTFTVDGRPHDNVSLRLEYRRDQAASDVYFSGNVQGNGTTTPYVANSRSQDTITAAAMAWF
jgi:hypothetical protein